MEKIIISSIAITLLFLAAKFFEKKVLQKHAAAAAAADGAVDAADADKPLLKDAFRDGILVFMCSLGCLFAIEPIWPLLQSTVDGLATGEIVDIGAAPKVFSGLPEF